MATAYFPNESKQKSFYIAILISILLLVIGFAFSYYKLGRLDQTPSFLRDLEFYQSDLERFLETDQKEDITTFVIPEASITTPGLTLSFYLLRIVFNWFTFALSFFIATAAFFNHTIGKDENYAFLGIIFLSIGILNVFHFLALDEQILSITDQESFTSFTWWISRIFFALAFTLALGVIKIKNWMGGESRLVILSIFTLLILVSLASLIYYSVFDIDLPDIYQTKLSFLFLEFIPFLALISIGSFLTLSIYKQNHSLFFLGIFYCFMINILAEVYAYFSFGVAFTDSLSITNFLEIIALVPPAFGMIFENLSFYSTLQITEQKANEATEAKSRFLEALSHELRTPLTAILGYNDYLMQELEGPLNSAQKDSVQRSIEASLLLKNSLDEITDLSSIERGKLFYKITKNDLARVLNDAVQTFQKKAEEKKLSFHVTLEQDHFTVLSDCERLKQIIFNLFSAIINWCESSEIHCRVFKKDQNAMVEIQFQPIQKNEVELEDLFVPFKEIGKKSIQSIRRKLSMTLSKKFAEEQEGNLSIEQFDHKAKFTLRMKHE